MFKRYSLHNIQGQMIAVLAFSFAVLLAILTLIEVMENDNVVKWAKSDYTIIRLNNIINILDHIHEDELESFVSSVTRCHEGYILTKEPFERGDISDASQLIAETIQTELKLGMDHVKARFVTLAESDFSYATCSPGEMKFPSENVVVSLKLTSGDWLNAEVHPHEWHFTPTIGDWFLRSSLAFLLIGAAAVYFLRRLTEPLSKLTRAAEKFGAGLKVQEVEETGPSDLKQAIHSFNVMQKQVTGELDRRIGTLAAISHDIRTPLTALRVKVELIDDLDVRKDLMSSVDKMEKITTSALEFLKGESRNEPMRSVDLNALVESECSDFEEMGAIVHFRSEYHLPYRCRPNALIRGVRNLIQNAVKYAGSGNVKIVQNGQFIEISVADIGPGIPSEKIAQALAPFERLDFARDSDEGGFGLGLAIVKAVTEGHDGELLLKPNIPKGLIVIMQLPRHSTPPIS